MDFYLARNTYDSEELMTMRQVADYIDCSYWYIRALHSGVEKTTVPFPEYDTKIGRSPLWAKKTIDRWKRERSIGISS